MLKYFSPESSTIPVINIRTTPTATTTTTAAHRPIVYPTPPRPAQAPSKLTQTCPDSCIKAAKLGSCLAGCEQYIGKTVNTFSEYWVSHLFHVRDPVMLCS